MPQATPQREQPDQLYTLVDDEQYEELSELASQQIVHASVWEESLADALEQNVPGDEVAVDLDLYLKDNVYFELYGTLCYTNIEGEPLGDRNEIEQHLRELIKGGLDLEEIAVDEEDGLVLVLGQRHQPVFYLQVGAWLLDEWEELPDDAAS